VRRGVAGARLVPARRGRRSAGEHWLKGLTERVPSFGAELAETGKKRVALRVLDRLRERHRPDLRHAAHQVVHAKPRDRQRRRARRQRDLEVTPALALRQLPRRRAAVVLAAHTCPIEQVLCDLYIGTGAMPAQRREPEAQAAGRLLALVREAAP